NGRPVQVIGEAVAGGVEKIDFRMTEPGARGALVQQSARGEALRPFFLFRGGVFGTKLLVFGVEGNVVVFTIRHILSGWWSMNVLVREITALYEAFSNQNPSPLAELPIQYADYAAWQRSWLQGEVLEAETAYWKRQLAGAPPLLELPTDRPRPPVQRYRGAI